MYDTVSLFDDMANDESLRRESSRKALSLAHIRVENTMGRFLRGARDEAEFMERLGLVSEDFNNHIRTASAEVGYDRPDYIYNSLVDSYKIAASQPDDLVDCPHCGFHGTPFNKNVESCPNCGGYIDPNPRSDQSATQKAAAMDHCPCCGGGQCKCANDCPNCDCHRKEAARWDESPRPDEQGYDEFGNPYPPDVPVQVDPTTRVRDIFYHTYGPEGRDTDFTHDFPSQRPEDYRDFPNPIQNAERFAAVGDLDPTQQVTNPQAEQPIVPFSEVGGPAATPPALNAGTLNDPQMGAPNPQLQQQQALQTLQQRQQTAPMNFAAATVNFAPTPAQEDQDSDEVPVDDTDPEGRPQPHEKESRMTAFNSPWSVVAADGHWIDKAIKHPGALHRELGVPEGEKIPEEKLEEAEHSSNPKEKKRAEFAEELKSFHHGAVTQLDPFINARSLDAMQKWAIDQGANPQYLQTLSPRELLANINRYYRGQDSRGGVEGFLVDSGLMPSEVPSDMPGAPTAPPGPDYDRLNMPQMTAASIQDPSSQRDDSRQVSCPECGGDGRTNGGKECPRCHGKGKVPNFGASVLDELDKSSSFNWQVVAETNWEHGPVDYADAGGIQPPYNFTPDMFPPDGSYPAVDENQLPPQQNAAFMQMRHRQIGDEAFRHENPNYRIPREWLDPRYDAYADDSHYGSGRIGSGNTDLGGPEPKIDKRHQTENDPEKDQVELDDGRWPTHRKDPTEPIKAQNRDVGGKANHTLKEIGNPEHRKLPNQKKDNGFNAGGVTSEDGPFTWSDKSTQQNPVTRSDLS